MFDECYRVMKTNGVFRISCPDAEYIYQICKKETDFWKSGKKWFEESLFYNGGTPRLVDYLVREIATPKLIGYVSGTNNEEYKENYDTMEMNEFLEYLTFGLHFRKDYPGDHINYFTFSKIEKMLKSAGFSFVIRSKYLSSASSELLKAHKFDLTRPELSLYVEAIK